MTDTHTHLYMPEHYAEDAHDVVTDAIKTGVTRMVFPAVDLQTFGPLLELADAFPDNLFIAFGLHPTDLTDNWKEDLKKMREMLGDRRPVAVGEIGIDLHWDRQHKRRQMSAFAYQLKLALELDLPVIIHSRDALEETLNVISDVRQKSNGRLPELIFHSFTGTPEDVARIRQVCDPWFGINGVVTFKNARPLRQAIDCIGLDRILIETDSPYLAPTPWRGRRNESAYLPAIRDKISAQLEVSSKVVEATTDLNAARVFRF